MEGWEAVRYLHLLAMAFFVGGQIVIAAAVVPVERQAPDSTRMRAIARRFGWGSLIALGVLLATGIAMADHYAKWESSTLQLKLGLIVLLVLLTAVHLRYPRAHALMGLIFVVTLAVVWLGVSLTH